MKLPAEEEDKPKPNQTTPNKTQQTHKEKSTAFQENENIEEEICDMLVLIKNTSDSYSYF